MTLLVTPEQANILAELEAEGEIHVALVYRGTAENAQKFISAQEKLLEELSQKDDEKENNSKPEISQKPSESEAAEDNTSEDSSRENNSEIDKVIIDPTENSENISENNSDNSNIDSETEVISNAESV